MIATFRLVAVCSIVLLSLKTEIVQSAPSPQIPASEARNGTSSDKKPIRTRFPLPLPSFNLGGAFAHLPILHVPTTLQLNDQARKALVSFFGAARALQYLIQRELKTTAPKSDPTKANDGAQNVTSNSLDKNHTSSKPRRDISDQDNASSELVQDHSPEQLEAMEAQAIQEVLDKLPPETVNQVIQHLVQQEQALFQRQQEQQLLQQQQEQEFLGNLEHNFSNDQQHHLILEQNQPDILRKQEFLRHEQQKAPRQEVHELPRQQQKDFLQQQEVLRQRNFPSQEELFRNHEQKLPQQQRFLTQQQRQSPISQEQELLKQEFVLRQNQDRTGSSGAVHTRSVFERAAASPQEKPSQPRQRLILRYAAPDEEEEILKSTPAGKISQRKALSFNGGTFHPTLPWPTALHRVDSAADRFPSRLSAQRRQQLTPAGELGQQKRKRSSRATLHLLVLMQKQLSPNTSVVAFAWMMAGLSSCGLLVIVALPIIQAPVFVDGVCDRVFSYDAIPNNGTFTAPTLENPNEEGLQCVYMFIAGPGQRVKIRFRNIDLRGIPPECSEHEYIDLYTQIEDPTPHEYGPIDPRNIDLVKTPFGGRYCGRIPPRLRISLYRTLAIGYFTDKNETTEDRFWGEYAFIDASNYSVGVQTPGTVCNFTIRSTAALRKGMFLSPTYPGAYPKNITCSYRLKGEPNQRIRLEFRDFDLFAAGEYCPFDYVRLYDGPTEEAPLMGSYCGPTRNLVVFSESENLLVVFKSLGRMADMQNRGYQALFEFSVHFVKLDFITESSGEHIRGTQCDQKVLSVGRSNGTVVSPNYPFLFLPNMICRYFIYGLQDKEHLERVRIEFERFGIPAKDGTGGSMATQCESAYLRVYLNGQEVMGDYGNPDGNFCGERLPPVMVSNGPRILLIFSAGTTPGTGFKAKYTFETEYLIPGTPRPERGCHFSYVSATRSRGEFNSPRFPAYYPSNTTCTYVFKPQRNQQVQIVFQAFSLSVQNATATYGDTCLGEDYVEIFNVYRDSSETMVGRYCSIWTPGPIESNQGADSMKIIMHANHVLSGAGFKAHYEFIDMKSVFGECGGNISGTEDGVIETPNFGPEMNLTYKKSQTCNWYIHARPGYRILLWFETFGVEGDAITRGCGTAAVRVWVSPKKNPQEICGENLKLDWREFQSEGQTLRLLFIASSRAIGGKGFRAIWTQVLDQETCDQFMCSTRGFCISKDLICNQRRNCGDGDTSDEDSNCLPFAQRRHEMDLFLLLGVALGLFCVMLIGLCVCCQRSCYKKREKAGTPLPLSPHTPVRPGSLVQVCDHHSSTLTGLRMAQHTTSADAI
ncbi:unnamed protein product [Cyprideis torosa]|uniref:Uncharacterized protein n=1 Tax=Cyprideis torosa TaxID=163714 RepID=A0A7R8VZV3_9CRUS|nr:unnamed protein product [Cyprideis torosa]CAG0879051.1 unnamed protein product [Cyprideis torosa]